jgi:type 1 glutamine amidotransferase
MRFACRLLVVSLVLAVAPSSAAEKEPPIKALMITGGCCHDYEKQKTILSEGISARANVEWTIVHEGGKSLDHKVSIFEKEDWAKPYDVVVHNQCFANQKDLEHIHRITEAHKAGVPAVVIHCAMHCYRGKTDQWFKLVGVRSHNHGRQAPITVETVERGHPVMKGFPANWKTPQGELYNIAEIYETTTPLAKGYSTDPAKTNACIWTGQFGKTRVFGTTIGHHNVTMEQDEYLGLVSRGLLWSVGKLADDGQPYPGYEGTGVTAKPKGPEPTPAE